MLAGMNEYLTKPFTPEQLAATFNRCCQLYGEKYLSLLEGVDKFIFSPLLDSDYLSELYGDDLEYALEMFEIFLQNTPAEIDMLFVTVTSKDYQGTAKITHKIKPTFNMVGLTRQSKILDELEIKAKNENVPFKEFKEVWMNRLYSIFPLIQEEVLRIQKFLNSRSLASQFTEL